MKYSTAKANSITIYIAGDLQIISQFCRKYCYDVGFCVTVTPTTFIYTGGEESGVAIGIVNYPRFQADPKALESRAMKLAEGLIYETHQHSALIVTPERSI